MNQGMEEKQIEEIKNLKEQLRYWRWGLLAGSVLIAIASISQVNAAFRGLVDKGPKQDEFIAELKTGMEAEIVPMMEDMAKMTLNEVQPEVNKAIDNVNARLPELAQATLAELDALEANLPKRGEAVLTKTFGQMLVSKEAELQQMFPEATPEQIERLLTNLGESSGREASAAAVELFGNHHETLMKIHANLEKIRSKEEVSLASVDPSWEMGLLVLDLFREDLSKQRPDKNGTLMAGSSDSITAARTVATPDSKPVAKPATKPASKPAVKSTSKSAAKPAAKPAVKTSAKPSKAKPVRTAKIKGDSK
ncbi:hypothetical protein QPK87_05380 [Kamptonema cortianum]|nr:hypothetical protein [Geitlerinema splendidum]MDK3156009.1 hypothetical protein [Kamptonema cortianum]